MKAVGFILQRAQLHQVIHAILIVFDVAVEHGGVGLEADLMGLLRCLQPLVAVDFVIADDVPYAVGENFRAASGK